MFVVGDPVVDRVRVAVSQPVLRDQSAPVHDAVWGALAGPNRGNVWEMVWFPMWWPVYRATQHRVGDVVVQQGFLWSS